MADITVIDKQTDYIVVHKPIGVGFHDENDETGFFNQVSQIVEGDLYPVHRLDKVTSGVMVMARTKAMAQQLGKAFESHRVEKFYLAISDRKPKKKQGMIKGDMQKGRRGSWILSKTQVNPACTQFFTQSLKPGLRAFLLKPLTGRTHQIRVVMKSLGAPILGDALYGGTDSDRCHLHALSIGIPLGQYTKRYIGLPVGGDCFEDGATQALLAGEWKTPWALPWPKV